MSLGFTEEEVIGFIEHMTTQLRHYLHRHSEIEPVMVGIRTGGIWVAERLHQALQLKQPLGTLNINFYRDDFTHNALNPSVEASQLPFGIEHQHVILVDDILMTGRTIRAAMNELFDYGRPASIILATLIDLQAQELPIKPNVVGITLHPSAQQRFKLKGPHPLYVEQCIAN